MWAYMLQIIIVSDLLINLFFHIIQLRRWCCQRDALYRISGLVNGVDRKLNHVETSTRRLQEAIGKPAIEKPGAETRAESNRDGVGKEEEVD